MTWFYIVFFFFFQFKSLVPRQKRVLELLLFLWLFFGGIPSFPCAACSADSLPRMLYSDLSSGFTQPPAAPTRNNLLTRPHLLQPHSPPGTEAASRGAGGPSPRPQTRAKGQTV